MEIKLMFLAFILFHVRCAEGLTFVICLLFLPRGCTADIVQCTLVL